MCSRSRRSKAKVALMEIAVQKERGSKQEQNILSAVLKDSVEIQRGSPDLIHRKVLDSRMMQECDFSISSRMAVVSRSG